VQEGNGVTVVELPALSALTDLVLQKKSSDVMDVDKSSYQTFHKQ